MYMFNEFDLIKFDLLTVKYIKTLLYVTRAFYAARSHEQPNNQVHT